MMATYSIRLRLTAWYSAVLLLGLMVFGLAMWFSLEQFLIRGIDLRLTQRIDGLKMVLEVESPLVDRAHLQAELTEFTREVPNGGMIELRDGAGKQLLPAGRQPLLSEPMSPGQPTFQTLMHGGRPIRLLTSQIAHGGMTYYARVAAPLDEAREVMGALRTLLLLMIPAILLCACLGGYWISRRALTPVDEVTRIARSISVHNLSLRLNVPQTGDELQRMSETWNELLTRLEGAVQRIQKFTADASHELRTPVTLIRATAELALRRERTPLEYRKSLADILQESERMTQLTESLLTLARADSSGTELLLSETDLNAIVSAVILQSRPLAEARSQSLRQALTPEAAWAAANAEGIRRLLIILLDNAFKYTPPGGTITVATAATAEGVKLSVEDTGEGISPASLPHIFERFYRADPARGGRDGVGLGLSIAKMIAQAHGTEIVVESKPGAGARFSILLKRV